MKLSSMTFIKMSILQTIRRRRIAQCAAFLAGMMPFRTIRFQTLTHVILTILLHNRSIPLLVICVIVMFLPQFHIDFQHSRHCVHFGRRLIHVTSVNCQYHIIFNID